MSSTQHHHPTNCSSLATRRFSTASPFCVLSSLVSHYTPHPTPHRLGIVATGTTLPTASTASTHTHTPPLIPTTTTHYVFPSSSCVRAFLFASRRTGSTSIHWILLPLVLAPHHGDHPPLSTQSRTSPLCFPCRRSDRVNSQPLRLGTSNRFVPPLSRHLSWFLPLSSLLTSFPRRLLPRCRQRSLSHTRLSYLLPSGH